VLAKQKFNLRERDVTRRTGRQLRPFTAQTRMSGVDLTGAARRCARARPTRCASTSKALGGSFPRPVQQGGRRRRARGSTPLVVADGARVLGVVELKDIVKGGIKERFAELRRMGIKTVMITGDNPLTAAAIAAEAGVDDFLAEATPEAKLR
jgi:K+-transporting ATPase ATPase B chain